MVEEQTQEQSFERRVVIRNPHGLHMRPAMDFVDRASRFLCAVSLQKGGERVDGKSIMQLALLRATQGTELRLTTSGQDAGEAVEVLAAILEKESYDSPAEGR